jgi:hypothetical protein
LAIATAEKDSMQGRHGVILNQIDPNINNPIIGRMEKLTAGDTGSAYDQCQQLIDSDIVNIGFDQADVKTDPNKTATAIESEQIATQAGIQVLIDQNAPEFKFLIRVTLDFIKNFSNKKNSLPLDTGDLKIPKELVDETLRQSPPEIAEIIRPEVEKGLQSQFLKEFTLGSVVELLENYDVDVEVQTGSNLKPVNIAKMRRLQAALPYMVGRKGETFVLKEYMDELGIVLTDEDLQPFGASEQQQQQEQQASGQAPIPQEEASAPIGAGQSQPVAF